MWTKVQYLFKTEIMDEVFPKKVILWLNAEVLVLIYDLNVVSVILGITMSERNYL